jgi:hypothetical protein
LGKAEVPAFRADVNPAFERQDARDLVLQGPERVSDLLDLVAGASILVFEYDDVLYEVCFVFHNNFPSFEKSQSDNKVCKDSTISRCFTLL